jgi:hypothetical protein
MEYKGKLYGKVGNSLFPLLYTTDDWEAMEKRIAELEAENTALKKGFPTTDEIKTALYNCAKVSIESDGVKMERLFEKEAEAVLALFISKKS